MKTPAELATRLARQWESADTREHRLLDPDAWPVVMSIGRPTATMVARSWGEVRAHLDRWRQVAIGAVEWTPVSYRATDRPIEVPSRWHLSTPSDWVEACDDLSIASEFSALSHLVEHAEPRYHRFLIRRRAAVLRPEEPEVMAALTLAEQLEPGCAGGVPLRALSMSGVDTKFYERNRSLLVALLDIRFDGAVTDQGGLESFLGAAPDGGHWLLVADLDGELLDYHRMRVTDTELAARGVPGTHLLVVENERCLHSLPTASRVIAILGAGLNLSWLASDVFADHHVGYWGDLDTWGLAILGRARQARPDLTPLLMDQRTLTRFEHLAVPEPTPATEPPCGLVDSERQLFNYLLGADRGRLEQEFLAPDVARAAILSWAERSNNPR